MHYRIIFWAIFAIVPTTMVFAAEEPAKTVQVKGAAICKKDELKEDCSARALINAKYRAGIRGGDTVVSDAGTNQIEARVTVINALLPNFVRNLETGNLECEVEIIASVNSTPLSLDEREQRRKDLLVKLLQQTNNNIESIRSKIEQDSIATNASVPQNIVTSPEQIAANRDELKRINSSDDGTIGQSLDRLSARVEVPPLPDGILETDVAYWKSAYQGNATAQSNLGWIYTNGNGIAKDYSKAVAWYQKAADQGNAWAQNSLGMRYLLGQGVPVNAEQAALWFRKAAEQDFSKAIYNLAVLYENGNGVKSDLNQAIKWYQKSAEMGDSDSQNNLGQLYLNGTGVDKDYIKGVSWFRKAADQGHAGAQVNLAVAYSMGIGVEKNIPQTFYWLTKAAEQGNEQAQLNLGLAYDQGLGGIKDFLIAMQWYKKSAEQNNAMAMFRIGRLYRFGYGVNLDQPQAIEWFRKAANKGNSNAIKTLQELGVQN